MNILSRVPAWIVISVSAILYALSFPPVEITYLSLVALAPFFVWLVEQERVARAVWYTILFWAIFGGIVVSFAFDPILFGANILLWLGMPVSVVLIRHALAWRRATESRAALIVLTLLPFVWIFWEYAQASFAPIPSHIIAAGNTLADTIFFPLASFGGLYGLSFIVVLSNIVLALAWLSFQKRVSFQAGHIVAVWFIYIFVLVFLAQIFLQQPARGELSETEKTRIVSFSVNRSFLSDITVYEKIFIGQGDSALERFEKYLEEGLGRLLKTLPNEVVDLVVLPEWLTEYTIFAGDHDEQAFAEAGITNNGTLIRAYREFARSIGAPVLANANIVDVEGNLFNSSLLFDADGKIIGRYDKTQRVLGSEYWPFGDVAPAYKYVAPETFQSSFARLKKLEFSANKTPFSTLALNDTLIFGTPICLEGQLPKAFKEFKNGDAQFLINDSSQAWIGFNARGYRKLTLNTSRILARYYGLPMILGGRNAYAGLISSDGFAEVIFHDIYPQKAFVSEI